MSTPKKLDKRSNIIGIFFALSAAVSYGISQVLAKKIVTDYAEPQVAAMIGIFFGMIGMFAIGLKDLRHDLKSPRQAQVFIVISGIFSSIGVLFLFLALDRSPIVVVTPIAATTPLIAIVFSIVFLRSLEKVTLRVILGAILVVVGIALVVLGRST
jgi:DME family drug/metabolite transporter